MTMDRSPELQSLFDLAQQDLPDKPFTDQVMSQVDTLRRRAVIIWSVIGLLTLALMAVIAGPLTQAVGLASQVLPSSLVSVDDQLLAQLLSPINSVAAIVALAFLGTRMIYRKIFS